MAPALGTRPSCPELGESDPALLRALAAAQTYGEHGPVQVRETHASWIFLVGEHAYKIKKPVALGFLDYSTLSARHEACRAEIRVNRELAPEIYLGVQAILAGAYGVRLAAEDSPGAVEYAVQMRRFDEAQTIAGRIEAGALGPAHVQATAERLARFHRAAPVISAGGAEPAVESWQRNLAELGAIEHEPSWRLDLLARFGEAFVHGHSREIDRRVARGRVRDGHGDLRCEHVLIADSVQILDRIEFDPALRQIDVCADLAFLTMDLESRGQAWAARELVEAYGDAGGDAGSEALRCFYAAERALVRVKVSLLDATEHSDSRREAHRSRAEALLALAERFCWRARQPLAILLCGPPASGKSTLATYLSRRSGIIVVSSDTVRKQLAGLPADARAAPERYSEQFTLATYKRLAEQALERLLVEGGVIVDATAHSPWLRSLLLDRLTPHARCLTVDCQASTQTTLQRAAHRMADRHRVSDATPLIAARALADFQAPDELPRASVLSLDTETKLDEQYARVLGGLDALPPYAE
jgi:aminoglycoside phosphotransferase family enzyme/predicted kinase